MTHPCVYYSVGRYPAYPLPLLLASSHLTWSPSIGCGGIWTLCGKSPPPPPPHPDVLTPYFCRVFLWAYPDPLPRLPNGRLFLFFYCRWCFLVWSVEFLTMFPLTLSWKWSHLLWECSKVSPSWSFRLVAHKTSSAYTSALLIKPHRHGLLLVASAPAFLTSWTLPLPLWGIFVSERMCMQMCCWTFLKVMWRLMWYACFWACLWCLLSRKLNAWKKRSYNILID